MNRRLAAVLTVWVAALASPYAMAQWEGVTEWSRQVELATAVSGVVAEVPVNAGDEVKSGQLLMQLDQRALKARQVQARAEVHYQRMQQIEANKELERAEEMYERTLLADHELDLAKIAAAKAMASYQAALAEEQLVRQELVQSEIRAPFDARVVARHIQPGQTVVTRLEAAPMLVLAEVGSMEAHVALPAAEAAGLANGQSVQVEVAGQQYPGVIYAIQYLPVSDRPYRIQARFQVDAPLLAGLPASVRLP